MRRELLTRLLKLEEEKFPTRTVLLLAKGHDRETPDWEAVERAFAASTGTQIRPGDDVLRIKIRTFGEPTETEHRPADHESKEIQNAQ